MLAGIVSISSIVHIDDYYYEYYGFSKDLRVAKEWCRKAVKAGNDKAKENLKRLGEKV